MASTGEHAGMKSRDLTPMDGALYGPEYYASHLGTPYRRDNPHWLQFFGGVADEIVRRLTPRTVLDIGCAMGFLVECLRDRGVEAYGWDVSEYAISQVRPDIRPYCQIRSATEPISAPYDLITCIEVCEHMPHDAAESAIRNMCASTDTILFSSTPTDFTEPTHVNVRPILDWLHSFAGCSFTPEIDFDAEFISAQAFLLRRTSIPANDCTMRVFAALRDDAIVRTELRNQVARLQAELNSCSATLNIVLNFRGWRVLERIRRVRRQLRNALVDHSQ